MLFHPSIPILLFLPPRSSLGSVAQRNTTSKSTWEERALFQLASYSSPLRIHKRRACSRDNGWMLLSGLLFLWLAQLAFFYSPGTLVKGWHPPTHSGLDPHYHHLVLKKMHQSHGHGAVWSRLQLRFPLPECLWVCVNLIAEVNHDMCCVFFVLHIDVSFSIWLRIISVQISEAMCSILLIYYLWFF